MTALAWTAEQELLLRGAVGVGRDADRAAADWLAQCSIQDLGPAEYRVLPLIAARLPAGADDPLAAQVHKVVRFTWLRTQLLVTRSAAALRSLTDAGVPVMLAKGAAVLAHTGWPIQLRPMDDLDVVVPRGRAAEAAGLLRAAGLTQPSLPADPTATAIYDELHGLGFDDPAGAIVDVHWHVLHGSLHHGADAEFWERAEPALLRDLPVQVLSREDTLLQVVAHGMELNVQHPLRWAADAVLLLRGAPAFDWDRLAHAARRHRLAGPVSAALRELRDVAPDVLPSDLPPGLRRAARRSVLPARAGAAGAEVEEFVRRAVAPGERPRPGHALTYLKELWALESAREIPRHAAWVASGRRPRLTPRCAPVPDGAEPIWVPGEAGFATGEAGTGMLGPGWWSPDAHGVWSRGREAQLLIGLAFPVDGPLRLDLQLVPFLSAARPRLTVDVVVDGRRGPHWEFTGTTLHEHARTLVLDGPRRDIRLRLVLDGRISPERAGELADPRPIGLQLLRVGVAPAGAG